MKSLANQNGTAAFTHNGTYKLVDESSISNISFFLLQKMTV
jgi:hypothetical protein